MADERIAQALRDASDTRAVVVAEDALCAVARPADAAVAEPLAKHPSAEQRAGCLDDVRDRWPRELFAPGGFSA